MEDEILEILDVAEGYTELDDNQKKEVLREMERKWKALPISRYQYSESAMIALMMIEEYFRFKNIEKAKEWAEVIINNKNRPDFGEKEFLKGRVLFEENKLDEALNNFQTAFKKSKGRSFEGKDQKYIDFLQNPEKYMTK